MLFGSRSHRAPVFQVRRHVEQAQNRLVIFAEHLDATYHAYFHYALGTLADEGLVSFYVLSAEAVKKAGPPRRLVESLARELAPRVAVLVRYASPHGDELVASLRDRKIRTIYHIDDDLLSVPPQLGSVVTSQHAHPDTRAARQRLMESVDLVLPSTVRLADTLRARIPGAKVAAPLPPAYLGGLIPPKIGESSHKDPTFGYMASKSHGADLQLIQPAVQQVLDARRDTRFELFGTLPVPTHLIERYGAARVNRHPPAASYENFLAHLSRLSWRVGLAPLLRHEFNRCKSAIKFMEYAACGIPAIVSSGDAYSVVEDRRNGMVAESPDEWAAAISELLDNPALAERLIRRAQADCEEQFGLDRVASRLLQVVREA